MKMIERPSPTDEKAFCKEIKNGKGSDRRIEMTPKIAEINPIPKSSAVTAFQITEVAKTPFFTITCLT